MTMTENKPEEASARAVELPAQPALPPPPPGGLAGVVGTSDHKTIGRLYLGFSFLFLLAGLAISALVAAEGVDASSLGPLTENTFFQVATLSQVTLVFLAVLPALVGLATYVVPLQLGSATIAFPRAAAAAFWSWLIGAGIVVASFLSNGGPVGGNEDAVRLFFAGSGMVIVALALGIICVVTTVATVRPAGMTLLRVPTFSWSMLVAGSIWLFNLAALLGNLILVYVDTDHAKVLYGVPGNVWPQLQWIFAQPAVLSLTIPVLGIIGDIVPVMTGRRQERHPVTLGAIAAFGVLTFGAYAQTVLNPRVVEQALFVLMSLAVVLPVLACAGGWGDTIRRGRPRVVAPFLLAQVAVLGMLASAVAAAAYAFPPLDLTNTVWRDGVMKLAIGTALVGLAAGLFFWGGKIWGRRIGDALGSLVALVMLGGVALWGGADLVSGGLGQLPTPATGIPDRVVDGAEILSLVSAIGAGLLVLGTLLAIFAMLPAVLRSGPGASADPWNGHTLEWAAESPPVYGNFTGPILEIRSPAPMLDLREAVDGDVVGGK